MYTSEFEAAQSLPDKDGNRIYVPINTREVAGLLGDNPQVLFGRLYYHLDTKYRYQQAGGAMVHLFSLKVGSASHCINYPFLCALLADMRDKKRADRTAFLVSIFALFMSLGSIIAQLAS